MNVNAPFGAPARSPSAACLPSCLRLLLMAIGAVALAGLIFHATVRLLPPPLPLTPSWLLLAEAAEIALLIVLGGWLIPLRRRNPRGAQQVLAVMLGVACLEAWGSSTT